MAFDLRRAWLPFAHRFFPTVGPGGVVDALLSRALHTDVGGIIHVTRHFDVIEVWQRDDDFSVRIYDEKMTETTGPFFLGMNDRERYMRDAEVIWRAVRKEDRDLVQRIAAEETDRALDRVRRTGRVDVVKDVSEPVLASFVARYYGIRVPDPMVVLRRLQQTSKFVFAFWSDPKMRADAVKAGGELRRLLEDVIAARRRDGDVGDGDVMGRFLGMKNGFYDGDVGIARSIAGLASGNLNAPVGLFVFCIDQFLKEGKRVFGEASALARSASRGNPADDARLKDFLFEAERFNVYPPFLYRYAERDTTLAAGTNREKAIPKGSTVINWASIAAFDEEIYERPFDFLPGRPKWQYLGFGYGRHRCLGEHIGQTVLHEMTKGLLALPGLRRAPGKAGELTFLDVKDGKYATSLGLVFDRSS